MPSQALTPQIIQREVSSLVPGKTCTVELSSDIRFDGMLMRVWIGQKYYDERLEPGDLMLSLDEFAKKHLHLLVGAHNGVPVDKAYLEMT